MSKAKPKSKLEQFVNDNKSWNKLDYYTKVIKIRNYVEARSTKKKLQRRMIIALTNCALDSSFLKLNNVVYNPETGKIISMKRKITKN